MFLKKTLLLLLGLVFLANCRRLDNGHTITPILDRSDIQKISSPFPTEQIPHRKRTSYGTEELSIPEVMRTKISFSVTKKVPLGNALMHLSRQLNINLEVPEKIEGSLHFSAHQRPFIEIIDHISDLLGLSYKIIGNSLRLEKDIPHPKIYNIQFLNLSRNTENSLSVATDIFSPNQAMGGDMNLVENGSNSSVKVSGGNDFWSELETNLEMILSSTNKEDHEATFSLHRQGGMVSINATQKQHKLIQSYLSKLRRSVGSQVLIEAKVIEVILKDQYRAGINWEKLMGGDLFFEGKLGNLSGTGPTIDPYSAQSEVISFGLKGQKFTSLIKALEQFGTSRTLSSPRLTVMNNQTAILKVAQNQVYFRLNYDKHYYVNSEREGFNVSSDIQTVPVGLIMSVQPSIDEETGDIILALRPTISRFSQTVEDPAVNIIALNSKDSNRKLTPSLVPIMEVQEFDTVMRLPSDLTGVLGGLMEIRTVSNDVKVPGASNIPFLGNFFKGTSASQQVVELVILLRATIINQDNGGPDRADKYLYEHYFPDSRRLP